MKTTKTVLTETPIEIDLNETTDTSTKPKLLKTTKGSFFETRTAFGRIHQFLIKKKIIDGSADSLFEDILDGTISDDAAIDLIVKKIGPAPLSDIVEKLVYIALSGFFKLEIYLRLKRSLVLHLKDCNDALAKQDYAFMRTIVMNSDNINEKVLVIALNSRITALKQVLAMHGDRFYKRSIFVSPGFKLDMSNR